MDICYRRSLLVVTLFTIDIYCKSAWSLNAGLLAYKSASFSVPSECALCEPKFNRFIIHNGTGDVYIGASNSLTHVDSNYNEIKTISTRFDCGDLIDEEECINHNKLLSIFYETDKLITCGSLNDGKCQIRDTSDISFAMEESETVVPSGELGTAYVIAPGKISDSLQEVLYVAATLDPERRGNLPHVCRRRLAVNGPLNIPNDASVTWAEHTSNDFIINAVDGFVYKGFTYFVTNQEHDVVINDGDKDKGWNNVIPKIKRVCQKSEAFDSYTDIGMRCQGKDGTTYNLIQDAYIGEAGSDLAYSLDMNPGQPVLYAVFANSVQETNDQPNNQSAICIYDLNDIAEEFVKAIEVCLMSADHANGIIYLSGRNCDTNINAALARSTALFQQCTAVNYAYPIGRIDTPVISEAIMEWPDTLLSSIITTTERRHTIAFIGSVRGELLKTHIENVNESRVYETLSLGSPVLKDPALDVEKQHITVLTEQTIYKLMVENCGYYTTCDECIGSTENDGDPYCGWCTLQRRCTRWHNCSLPDESTRWLSYNVAQCSGISKVMPFDSQPISTPHKITVTVEQLPDLGAVKKYECVFELGNHSLASTATKTGNDLECMTPDIVDLAEIPSETDHVTMLVSIRSTETGVKFVDTNHTFYECGTHTRCIDCASSKWACDWCTYGNICTHDKDQCPDDNSMSLIAGEKHHKVNPPRRGPAECAQIELHEVLLAAEVDREIDITVKNLPDMNQVPAGSYECVLYIEGKEQKVAAHRTNEETVRCNKKQFTYKADIQELRANLTLHWTWAGSQRTIDDESGFEVTLYKCEVLRPDCSRCVSVLSSRPELRCGWCSDAEMCAVKAHSKCSGFWIRETPVLGVETKNCPRPKIHSIWPKSGPIEGNTLIEITGNDFGRSFNNIVSVKVAGRQCMHSGLQNMFEISERLFCYTTMAIEADETGDVLITVQGLDNSDQVNDGGKTFTYRDPKIVEFNPGYGPAAGGTMLTIKGNYLMTGRDIDILVGNTSCSIIRNSSTSDEVTCLSGATYEGYISPIKMIFDALERRSEEVYIYKANPVVDSVNPLSAFKAGGRVLTVEGSNLDVVQTPQVRVAIGRYVYTETCKLVNKSSSIMTCPSPKVDLPTKQKRQADGEQAVLADLGFIMDGFRDFLVWNDNNIVNNYFRYFEDPHYQSFTATKYFTGGALLQLKGERIDLASTEADVAVFIGDQKCSNISLQRNALTCNVPEQKPKNSNGSDIFKVYVIQGNLYFDNIGYISYKSDSTNILSKIITLVAVIICLILVGVILLVLLVLYRKRYRSIIAQRETSLLESVRRLKLEADRGLEDAQANLSIKLSNNVTINVNDVQIQYSQLTFGIALGKGEFGKVFMATLTLPDGVKNVAVKTIKDGMDASFTLKFLEEALIMKKFDHQNVLSLLGLTFDPDGNPLVVLPFMKNGDIRSFLLKTKTDISDRQMLNFALDGAKGMTYLSELGFVHRDLAARNCMVDGELNLRIADFGLSRDMHESDYYRSGDRAAPLPVKWMAPESLARRIYNVKTDVWSFGILLWEMFARGAKPYKGIANRDVYQHIIAGNRLPSPPQCPVYGIMQKCWQVSPKSRPTFREIVTDIHSSIENIDITTAPSLPVAVSDASSESYLKPMSVVSSDTDYEVQLNINDPSNMDTSLYANADVLQLRQNRGQVDQSTTKV